MGYFLNTLVMRTDLFGVSTFVDLMKRVRPVVLDALAHQDLPFAKLVEELQPKRDPTRNPLFQALFVLEPPIEVDHSSWADAVVAVASKEPSRLAEDPLSRALASRRRAARPNRRRNQGPLSKTSKRLFSFRPPLSGSQGPVPPRGPQAAVAGSLRLSAP